MIIIKPNEQHFKVYMSQNDINNLYSALDYAIEYWGCIHSGPDDRLRQHWGALKSQLYFEKTNDEEEVHHG